MMFPVVIAGDDDRAAVAFLGTSGIGDDQQNGICAPEFQIICTVLGLTPICKDRCFANVSSPAHTAAATTVSPSIYCDIDPVCYVLYPTVCRNGCYVATTTTAPARAEVIDRR
jgi:hypothetical protein